MTNVKLTEKSVRRIMLNLVCNKIFVLAPLYFKQHSGGSAFIVTTLVFATSCIIWNLFCNASDGPITKLISNILLKNILLYSTIIISVVIVSLSIQQYGLSLKTTVLKQTPLYIITIILLASILVGYDNSLKSVGNAAVIFTPTIYIIALLLVISSVSRNDWYNFFPIFDTTHNTILSNFILMLTMLFELIYLFFIPDMLYNPKETRKTGNSVICFSYVCFLVIGIVFSITIPTLRSTSNEPFFQIIKMAHIGNFSANFDSVFLLLYCLSAYIYLSSMFNLIIFVTKLTLIKLPYALLKYIIFTIISLLAFNTEFGNYLFNFISKNFMLLTIPTIIIPSIFLILNKVKKCN